MKNRTIVPALIEDHNIRNAVDQHVAALRREYADKVQGLECALRDERTFVEMACTFTLAHDGVAREHLVKMGTLATTSRAVRLRYVEAVFGFIRGLIDDAIADTGRRHG